MVQMINSNIPSLNAQRNLTQSQGQYEQALERLSSGLRINGAGDDPSGIAVSTRFQSQVTGLDQAIRNANDGVSLAQTAEGALGSMTDSLQRIRELALQSANATNTAQDREALNQEVQELKKELNRVSDETNFNGANLLDGSFENAFFQIGANSSETIDMGLVGSTLDNMGSAPDDGLTSFATGTADNDMEDGDLVINGVSIDAPTERNDNASVDEQAQSAIARAAAVNDKTTFTGVRAEPNKTTLEGSSIDATDTDPLPADATQLKLNGQTVNLPERTTENPDDFLTTVSEAINNQTDDSVEAVFEDDPADGVDLIASDGRNITLDFSNNNNIQNNGGNTIPNENLAAAFGLKDTNGNETETFRGTYSLISENGSEINLSSQGEINRAGFQQGTFSGSNSGAVGAPVSDSKLENDELVINGVSIRASKAEDDGASPEPETSAIAKAAAINADFEETGVTASATPTIIRGDEVTGPSGPSGNNNPADVSFQINGTSIDVEFDGEASVEQRQNAIAGAINARSGTTGVRAETLTDADGEQTFQLVAEDGRNVVINDFTDNNAPPASYSAEDFGFLNDANEGNGEQQIQRASVNLESAGSIEIDTNGNPGNAGFQTGTYGNDEESQLMRYVDISTTEGANEAIVAVDNALTQVNSQRAQLGAVQNRFESTISNQRDASANLQEANSRIEDADFAEESANLSKGQILQQAGLSVLSQANEQPQQVLQLLQG
ncbi:flagellin [Halovibrio salipaludis]|uniref:Flagellin n=1 Tax=Halovibrio salipaludis TaxID=2032626 RepID=A0A2A2F6M5_9GAMM|nr:flagellin [Halovibrio salipaludis]PAU80183.1 flagellin [Halovibrio salipaludis]